MVTRIGGSTARAQTGDGVAVIHDHPALDDPGLARIVSIGHYATCPTHNSKRPLGVILKL